MSYHPDWQVAAVSSKPSKWANPSSHSLAWGPSRLRTKPIPTDTLHAWRPFCCPNNHENIVIIGNMSLSNEKCLPTKLLGISGGVTLSLRCFLYVSGAWRVSKWMKAESNRETSFFSPPVYLVSLFQSQAAPLKMYVYLQQQVLQEAPPFRLKKL